VVLMPLGLLSMIMTLMITTASVVPVVFMMLVQQRSREEGTESEESEH
jgi:hypothetical protein